MKFINKHFNNIMIILAIVIIGLVVGLYMDGINKLHIATSKLHGNHLGLTDKSLLTEMNNQINAINKNLDDLNNNYNNKINRVLISLCNINDLMAVKPHRYDNHPNVGNYNKESGGAISCYTSMETVNPLQNE